MGHALVFDTHAYVKKLIAVGVSEAQAEVQAETLTELLESNLATKRDIADIKRDIATLGHDMAEMEMRLTIRLGAIMAGGIAIVTALVKLL